MTAKGAFATSVFPLLKQHQGVDVVDVKLNSHTKCPVLRWAVEPHLLSPRQAAATGAIPVSHTRLLSLTFQLP